MIAYLFAKRCVEETGDLGLVIVRAELRAFQLAPPTFSVKRNCTESHVDTEIQTLSCTQTSFTEDNNNTTTNNSNNNK